MINHVENPWKIRFLHHGYAHIELDWGGKTLHFDPILPPKNGDTVVLTWNWMSRLKGTVAALKDGNALEIVAPAEALDWLSRFGDFKGHAIGAQLDGLSIDLYPYTPFSPSGSNERFSQVKSAIKRPQHVFRRLLDRFETPEFSPVIAHLTFPSGARLLHLNLAVHNSADEAWINKMIQKFTGCDWLISGCDYLNEGSIVEYLPLFSPKHLLLTDLIGDSRKGLGMPTQLLTPVVDNLLSKGVDAHVFAPHASYRFDTIAVDCD